MSVIAFEEIINSSSNQYTFTALLIHGLLGSRDDFRHFTRSLASTISTSADWRMVVVDLRNHGSSVDKEEGLSPPHDMANAATDVANLFKSLNGDWPDVVIGHSLGGKVALQYAFSCAQGHYGDSVPLPKQLWVLDIIPGKMENKSQNEELVKALNTLQTLPSPIPSQEWLVDHMVNLGFSKFLSEYISSSLKKSGEQETFSFNIEGAIQMFKSARDTDYWPLLERPPKGMEIAIVRTESRLTWDPDVVERLESLAKRERDGLSGKVSVHVVPRSGHWIYKDEPERLMEIMAPRMASLFEYDDLQKPGWRNFLSFIGPGFLVSLAYLDPGNMIGTAFALNILFKIPVWVGVVLTGFSTLLLLGLQTYGVRKLEILIAFLVFVMAGCFFGEMSYVKPPATDVLNGMFVPKLSGQGAIGDTIALFGALVMPHNLFLHSALVLSRKIPNSVRGINFLIESGIALFVAFLINVSMIAVSGTVCSAKNLSTDEMDRCSDLTLYSASFLLKNVLGKSSSTLYAIALLASGQSSTITGTYAGQYIMQGFLDLKMRKWLRNLITRCIAIMPSLIVSIIGGSSGAGRLIIIASMILSFELPFALIPLLKFSSSATKMGPHKNSMIIIIFSWVLGLGLIAINIYYLITTFVDWLIHSSLPKVGNVFIGIIVFPIMAIYILSVIYLMFRKDVVVTFVEPPNIDPNDIMERDRTPKLTNAHYREDLANVLLPE
ncbi:hypothetical protein L6452_03650 [Arctium lappa]|uniref:Uncharacterized protein n=1 Tax=Arctium lappa TaxID=4217 RepID=A0ACB9FM95_ARCLA|nr:hypothetical protein L6452_03650 [Arctium lappa]